MSFPALTAEVPSLPVWGMSYAGLAFAGLKAGERYQLQSYPTGLDIPSYLSGDVQRALDQGEYAGLDLSPGRDITVQQVVRGANARELDENRQTLAGVLGPQGSTEQPLFLQLASGLFACMARPRKHAFVTDVNVVFGHGVVVSTLFHATDPRWYTAPTLAQTVGLPEPSGGLVPPVTPPVTIKGTGVGGLVTVENAGAMEMRPRVTFTGPCLNPRAANLALPGAPSIGFELALNPGDQLQLDLDWQSAVLVAAGTSAGSSRRNAEKPGNTWWNLPGKSSTFSGVSVIEFTSEDTTAVAGTMTVEYASARMGL